MNKAPTSTRTSIPAFLARTCSGHSRDPGFLQSFGSGYRVSARTLLYLRASFLAVSATALVAEYALRPPKHLILLFVFLTSLSWMAVIAYLGMSLYCSARWLASCRARAQVREPPRWFRLLLWHVYVSQLTFQPLIVLIYYVFLVALDADITTWYKWYVYTHTQRILYNDTRRLLNVVKHGILCVFIYADLSLNNIPVYLSQWHAPALSGLLFLAWGLIQPLLIDGINSILISGRLYRLPIL